MSNKKWIQHVFNGIVLLVIVVAGMESCSQGAADKGPVAADKTETVAKEKFVLYKKEGDVVHIARATELGKDSFELNLSDINTAKPEDAAQKLVSSMQYPNAQLEGKVTELKAEYVWQPVKEKKGNVVFIQIQTAELPGKLSLLDSRHDAEEEIDRLLKEKKLGERFAGDDGNMLFYVDNIENALPVIFEVLHKNELEHDVVIGRRINIEGKHWFYEVIYPAKFLGAFNTM